MKPVIIRNWVHWMERTSAGFPIWLQRAAAWWILYMVTPPANVAFDLAWWLGRYWPQHRQQVADFVQVWVVPSLLLDFIAWPFAYALLKAKAAQEGGQS